MKLICDQPKLTHKSLSWCQDLKTKPRRCQSTQYIQRFLYYLFLGVWTPTESFYWKRKNYYVFCVISMTWLPYLVADFKFKQLSIR